MSVIKIELEVDDLISDMYADQESDISVAIKDQIIMGVSREILRKIDDEVTQEILLKVSGIANEKIAEVANNTISRVLSGGIINTRKGKMSIDEHILNLFNNHQNWNSPEAYLEKKAKQFATDMKARADVIFATKIVMNIKEQGLLKDGVAEMLLGNDTK